jgi:hypothetical protein
VGEENLMPDHPTASVLSWRDVYKAVGDSEERIIAAMKETVRPLHLSSEDHEMRMRKLESDGCASSREAMRVASAVGLKLDALSLIVNTSTAARGGMFATLSAGQKVVLFAAAIIGMTAVFLDIITKYL